MQLITKSASAISYGCAVRRTAYHKELDARLPFFRKNPEFRYCNHHLGTYRYYFKNKLFLGGGTAEFCSERQQERSVFSKNQVL